jgi:hypothetical protein
MFDTDAPVPSGSDTALTLYTDSHLVRGTMRTRLRRLSDILNESEMPFVVLDDVRFEEFGSRALIETAPYAQINLDTVLFAVASEAIEPIPEMRTIKVPEHAMIGLPPFRIVGRIHLLPERDLRQALLELQGRFLPVTDAMFWSERFNEPRTQAPMLAFNHSRAQILAPYQERDVWAGASMGAAAGVATADTNGELPLAAAPQVDASAWPTTDLERGGQAGGTPAASDPWRDVPG